MYVNVYRMYANYISIRRCKCIWDYMCTCTSKCACMCMPRCSWAKVPLPGNMSDLAIIAQAYTQKTLPCWIGLQWSWNDLGICTLSSDNPNRRISVESLCWTGKILAGSSSQNGIDDQGIPTILRKYQGRGNEILHVPDISIHIYTFVYTREYKCY